MAAPAVQQKVATPKKSTAQFLWEATTKGGETKKGEMEAMDRTKASEIVVQNGGRAASSVSKKTTYLVIGNEPGRNKIEDARKHKTQELNEVQFLEMIKDLK